MLTFTPGELSTFAQFSKTYSEEAYFVTSQFNFRDLPCPPRSVAASDLFPIFCFFEPSQLQNMNERMKGCTNGVFSIRDPPKTLEAIAVMTPWPNPAQNPGIQAEADSDRHDAAPASIPRPKVPEETAALWPKQKASAMSPDISDPTRPTPSLSQQNHPQNAVDPDQQDNQKSGLKEGQSHDAQTTTNPITFDGQNPSQQGGQEMPAGSERSNSESIGSHNGNDSQDPAIDPAPTLDVEDKRQIAIAFDQSSPNNPNILTKSGMSITRSSQSIQTVDSLGSNSEKADDPDKLDPSTQKDNTLHNFDPAHALPYQRSQLHDAFAPSQGNQAAATQDPANQQVSKPEHDPLPWKAPQTDINSSGDSIHSTQAQPKSPQGDD